MQCITPLSFQIQSQIEQTAPTSPTAFVIASIPFINWIFIEMKEKQLVKQFEQLAQPMTKEKIQSIGVSDSYPLNIIDLSNNIEFAKQRVEVGADVESYVKGFKILSDLRMTCKFRDLIASVALVASAIIAILVVFIDQQSTVPLIFFSVTALLGGTLQCSLTMTQSCLLNQKIKFIESKENKKFGRVALV